VDLKSDRQREVLQVQGAYAEDGAGPDVAVELAEELRLTAEWLGLVGIDVAERGDLAGALRSALRR
jgi:uncharacterized protein YcaQ